jgi:hypothetical protein
VADTAMARATPSAGISLAVPGQTPAGEPIFSVLLKRSYDIVADRPCVRAAEDRALVPADEFWDSPVNSSVRHESDLVPFKLGTDVVLNGRVHAPGGTPTPWCRATLRIAGRTKEVLVIGDRTARYANGGAPVFTEPLPFVTMDLRYERAYGGTDVYSDPVAIFAYPNNPLGRGFAVANTRASVENLPLPNLEDPANPLAPERVCIGAFANWTKQPFPAGFGWYPGAWMGRTRYAGIMPGDFAAAQKLRHAYAELLPPDQRDAYLKQQLPAMDFSYFQGASRGLAMPYLSGGEEVWAENLSPTGRTHFFLPSDMPRIGLDIGRGVQTGTPVIQTVMVHMEERQLDIVWRCAVPYPGLGWLPEMRKLEVHVE